GGSAASEEPRERRPGVRPAAVAERLPDLTAGRTPSAGVVETEGNLRPPGGRRHGVHCVPRQHMAETPVRPVGDERPPLAVDLEADVGRVSVDQLRGVSTRRSGDGEHGDDCDPPKVHPPAESVPAAAPATPRSSDAELPVRYWSAPRRTNDTRTPKAPTRQ